MSDFEGERAPVVMQVSLEETPREVLKAKEWFRRKKDATIYRVPPEIYACDENAYKPKAVCIGPFFHGLRFGRNLRSMQYYKWKCVKKLMRGEVSRQKCLMEMKELETTVRKKYSKKFESLDPDEFAWMLMLDGCFLLRLLLRYADGPAKAKVDDEDVRRFVGRLWIWELVRYDLLLLQNQIPFLVIQRLYELVKPDYKKNLVDCAINFFSPLDPLRKEEHPKFYIPVDDVHHLLHLVYESILPCPQYPMSSPKQQSSQQWIPSATELKLAGIKFKRRENARGGFLSFLDVKFSDGVMEIPRIKVSDYSISLFRNLIAFEQCYPDTKCHVTAYAVFMNFLINTEEDMRLLHLKKILINSMTVEKDKDATHFFSRLCNEVHYAHDENYLRKLFSDVTEYHDSRWHMWHAELNRKYFKSPLTIISLIAGTIALLLSFFGTIYNVVSRH